MITTIFHRRRWWVQLIHAAMLLARSAAFSKKIQNGWQNLAIDWLAYLRLRIFIRFKILILMHGLNSLTFLVLIKDKVMPRKCTKCCEIFLLLDNLHIFELDQIRNKSNIFWATFVSRSNFSLFLSNFLTNWTFWEISRNLWKALAEFHIKSTGKLVGNIQMTLNWYQDHVFVGVA